ncbi:helix-turn-helix transcriptional regulator [Lysobacter sp. A421]
MGKKTRKLSNKLRELRQSHDDMTQLDLANRVGITRQTVISIEANRYSPSLEVAFMIARTLGLGIEDVFQFDGDAGQHFAAADRHPTTRAPGG